MWSADLGNMQLISNFNKTFLVLLFIIDIYSKYAWVTLLKDEKGTAIFNGFLILILMQYLFVRTLKKKKYKCMNSILKNMYINILNDIVDKYYNTYHSTIKMKPADVKPSTYIDFDKNHNKKDAKFISGN